MPDNYILEQLRHIRTRVDQISDEMVDIKLQLSVSGQSHFDQAETSRNGECLANNLPLSKTDRQADAD